LNLNSNLFIR